MSDMVNSKSRVIICTVGTSFLEKVDKLTDFNYDTDSKNDIEFEAEYEKKMESYDKYELEEADLSSETNSLDKLNLKSDDEIILIPTRTLASRFCADAIKNFIINEKKNVKIEILRINELKSAKDEQFQEKGLPAFLNKVAEKVEEALKDNKEVILNPTGGYKSLFPIMTILGMLYNCKVIYLYEDSEKIIEIPPLPINIDVLRWDRIRNLLNLALSNPQFINEPFFEEIKGFYLKSENNIEINGNFNGFYNFFERNIKNIEKRFNPLFIKTKNYKLKEKLGIYSEKFDKLVELNYLIWKGDRVPEMVDHSIRHHTNLFSIAERILIPIFIAKPDLLNERELFLLLCGLFLHDSGHVVGYVKYQEKIEKLYPTEIRDFHHILTYIRFKNYDTYDKNEFDKIYFNKIFYNELGWGKPNEAWENYLKAITKITMYHRKKMPLKEGDNPFECFFFDEEIKPLEKEEIKLENVKINPKKVLLICALLRIIDSLDCQVARSGDEMEIKFHKSLLENEAELLKEKTNALLESAKNTIKAQLSLSQALNNSQINIDQELNKILKKIEDFISNVTEEHKKQTPGSGEQNNTAKKKLKFREELDKILEETKKNYFVKEYIELKLLESFKRNQIAHFDSHSKIKEIKIEFSSDTQKNDIIFTIKTDPIDERIIKDMKEEYDKVKDILNSYHIYFNYGKSQENESNSDDKS